MVRFTHTVRQLFLAAVILLIGVAVNTVNAGTVTSDDTAQLLARADAIKMNRNADFVKLLAQLQARASTLSSADQWHLRYLESWQTAFVGQNDKAREMLETIIKQAPDLDMREQARATLVNVLGLNHRYEEAFTQLDQSLEELPHITSNTTRYRVLAEASQLLNEAGQYDLAINYADQLMLIPVPMDYACLGKSIELDAEFRKGPHDDALITKMQQGANECAPIGHTLSVVTLRGNIAAIKIEQGKYSQAIALLQGNYEMMERTQYEWLKAHYDALLAEAYWKQNDSAHAEKYAYAAVNAAPNGDFVEPLSAAYQLLYQIAQQKGDLRDALMYHEKFLVADNTRLDDVREKALAYQVVKQQVDTKKAELDALSKKNQILQLQQALDHKAVEASRLYIVLLLIMLASIALWLYRLKRSQLRFMHLARRDSLTGILNRQYFVEEAEQSLRHEARSMRCATLLLIDLDHFKSVNDNHGHTEGDQVLRRVVTTCQRYLHSYDIFGRLGGEEFGILLPECTAELAIERAERIRVAIFTSHERNDDIPISASVGIASTTHHGHDLRQLLMAADEALYRAKRDGRNRVVINLQAMAQPAPAKAEGSSTR